MTSRARVPLIAAVLVSLAILVVSPRARAENPAFEAELQSIQHAWEEATYRSVDEDQKRASLEALSRRTDEFSRTFNGRAEPLIWNGIVLSSLAGAKGGLGALSLAKKARDSLQAALRADPNALNGSAYTSLGALYFKAPGFPLGFGDHRRAGEYLRKALELNPEGIDPNYFYGDLLFDEGNYAQAERYLNKALAAPARPGRALADSGRRAEASALLIRVKEKRSAS